MLVHQAVLGISGGKCTLSLQRLMVYKGHWAFVGFRHQQVGTVELTAAAVSGYWRVGVLCVRCLLRHGLMCRTRPLLTTEYTAVSPSLLLCLLVLLLCLCCYSCVSGVAVSGTAVSLWYCCGAVLSLALLYVVCQCVIA